MISDDRVSILVVDDQPMNLKMIEKCIQGEDREIIMVTNGKEAMDNLSVPNLALIILDVLLPDADGFSLAEQIRKFPHISDVPIIFISSILKDEEFIFKGYELGAVDYLVQPVKPIVLKSKVSVFVNIYQMRLGFQRQILKLQKLCRAMKNTQKEWKGSETRTLELDQFMQGEIKMAQDMLSSAKRFAFLNQEIMNKNQVIVDSLQNKKEKK